MEYFFFFKFYFSNVNLILTYAFTVLLRNDSYEFVSTESILQGLGWMHFITIFVMYQTIYKVLSAKRVFQLNIETVYSEDHPAVKLTARIH